MAEITSSQAKLQDTYSVGFDASLSAMASRQQTDQDLKGFNSQQSFNDFCRAVIAHGREQSLVEAPSPVFDEQIAYIKAEGGPGVVKTIPVAWGGVVVTRYDEGTKAYEKNLVVEAGGYLAFEEHEKKDETLEVTEGSGVLLYQEQGQTAVTALKLVPGVSMNLRPGQKHCIIALSNLVVFEHGVDPKGMDQDLIFTFTSEYGS